LAPNKKATPWDGFENSLQNLGLVRISVSGSADAKRVEQAFQTCIYKFKMALLNS